MPELGLTEIVRGYGSDQLLRAVRSDSSEFDGLVGLPLLRMLEFGGNRSEFWIRKLDLS